jgi:hypothetical protein
MLYEIIASINLSVKLAVMLTRPATSRPRPDEAIKAKDLTLNLKVKAKKFWS